MTSLAENTKCTQRKDNGGVIPAGILLTCASFPGRYRSNKIPERVFVSRTDNGVI